jgi:hypothetical protein
VACAGLGSGVACVLRRPARLHPGTNKRALIPIRNDALNGFRTSKSSRRTPKNPLQPTRAAEPFGEREQTPFGPRVQDHVWAFRMSGAILGVVGGLWVIKTVLSRPISTFRIALLPVEFDVDSQQSAQGEAATSPPELQPGRATKPGSP